MRRYDLVVVGHIGFDENRSDAGSRLVPGGAAYLVSLPASIYSRNVGMVSRVGEDYDWSLLSRLHIDLTGVKVCKGEKTARFYHVYHDKDGTVREFQCRLNACENLNPNDFPDEYLDSSFIHIATMPPVQQEPFVRHVCNHSDAMISIDTLEDYIRSSRSKIEELFRSVDLVFVDKREYDLIRATKDLGKAALVIKKGKDGAEYVDGGFKVSVPAPKAKVVDKTGSGDVLAGVFSVLLAQGFSPSRALKEAVTVASRSVEGFGVDFFLRPEGRV